LLRRRNYLMDKRERAKFERNRDLPAFKFYVKAAKIKEILYAIHMEEKEVPSP
jgi:hypothetical protein